MEPVEYDGMLPESEVFTDVVTDTVGSVRKEDKAMVFHEFVLYEKGDEPFEGFGHAYCRQCVLPVFCLDMYDCILNERPVLLAFPLAFRLLESYADVINADIAAFLSTVFYARG